MGILEPSVAEESKVEPDTTDWRLYFPLEIGNQWQFRVFVSAQESFHYGYAVVGDSIHDGVQYLTVRTCWRLLGGTPECTDDPGSPLSNEVVRQEPDHSLIVELHEPPPGTHERWWTPVPCVLDAPFNVYPVPCTIGNQQYRTEGGYGFQYVIPPDTVTASYKRFDQDFAPYTETGAVAGIGVVWRQELKGSDRFEQLVYARVANVEYGTVLFDLPTSVEDASPQDEASSVSLVVFPNPAGYLINIRVVGAGSVGAIDPDIGLWIDVVDVTGRTVSSRVIALNSISQPVQVPVSTIPAGTYLVRARTVHGETLAARSIAVHR